MTVVSMRDFLSKANRAKRAPDVSIDVILDSKILDVGVRPVDCPVCPQGKWHKRLAALEYTLPDDTITGLLEPWEDHAYVQTDFLTSKLIPQLIAAKGRLPRRPQLIATKGHLPRRA